MITLFKYLKGCHLEEGRVLFQLEEEEKTLIMGLYYWWGGISRILGKTFFFTLKVVQW